MNDLESLTRKYKQKIKKKNVGNKILYYLLQVLTLMTAIASLIMYIVRREGLETTANQIFMCIMALICMNIPVFLEKRFKFYIPNYISIILYVFIFAHYVLGEVLRVYDHSLVFDKILHTTSGVIMSFIGFSFIFMLNKINPEKMKLSPFFIVLFTFCFTMTTEYVWELFEYSADRLFNLNMQRWKDSVTQTLEDGSVISTIPYGSGLKDTMGDMAVNILGCLGVCVYALVGMKLKPDWFDGKLILTDHQIEELAAQKAAEDIARETENDDEIIEKPDEIAKEIQNLQASLREKLIKGNDESVDKTATDTETNETDTDEKSA